jgi:serine protease inhibitor
LKDKTLANSSEYNNDKSAYFSGVNDIDNIFIQNVIPRAHVAVDQDGIEAVAAGAVTIAAHFDA